MKKLSLVSTILPILFMGLILLLTFRCKKEDPKVIPTVKGASVTNITSTSATSGGEITSDGGEKVTARGVCWSVNQNPTTSIAKTSDGSGSGAFASNITGLTANTLYYLRAYATNSVGTAYGSQITFNSDIAFSIPTITTANATNNTSDGATLGGEVTSDGNAQITERGFVYGTTQNPTVLNTKVAVGTGTGVFSATITGLTAGKTYYARAYATNSQGTAYGNQIILSALALLPTLKTAILVTNIQATVATSGGEITSDGGGAIIARGVCWSTTTGPTVTNNKTLDNSGTGNFTSYVTGLSSSTTYYIRAYATNSAGTAYGNELSFKTTANIPTVTTDPVTYVKNITALCGGNVTSDGGSTITGRGVCWSTSKSPTISGSKTTNGIGLGSFSSSITGLTAGTLYYIRSYATNSIGTNYGDEKSFTTIEMLPTIITSTATSINENMALCGGNIISTGGHSIINYGVIERDKATGSLGIDFNLWSAPDLTGTFTVRIQNLLPDTEYNFYAFITTSAGTSTGEVLSFRTMPQISVLDYEGNRYTTTQIGTQIWLNENLRSTKYNDGTSISWYSDNASWAAIENPGYCFIQNQPSTGSKLYNYYTVNTGKLCPIGWHVPTDDDWTKLVNYLGGNLVAGGKMKYNQAYVETWTLPNIINLNELTNFRAMPGGNRAVYYNMFDGWTVITTSSFGELGKWWTSTINPLGGETNLGYKYGTAYSYSIVNGDASITRISNTYKAGLSVRCLKDN